MAGFCTLNFLAQYCYFSRWMIRQKKIQENDIFTEDKRAGQDFDDKAYIIYVNSGIQEDAELGRLMHDFHCKNASDMYSEILADRVRELKETQDGIERMCREMEELYNEGVSYGIAQGELKNKKVNAVSFSNLGISVEQIAQGMNVSVDQVKQWIAEGLEKGRAK